MTSIVSLVNQKGGVGKTTESISLAFESSLNKQRTLLVDADPHQQSIMGWRQEREKDLPANLTIISRASNTIHKDIKRIARGYDMVIIDGPPRLAEITRSILMASDLVVIPCTPSGLDSKATHDTLEIIREASALVPSLKTVITVNRKAVNTAIGKTIRKTLQNFGEDIKVLKAEVTMRIIFAEAMSVGLSVQEMANSKEKARIEISALYKEIMKEL